MSSHGPDDTRVSDFLLLPDLASRDLSGSVVHANDELFADKENLINPAPPSPRDEFGPKGKVYDGWETRRRRSPGHDEAIVRLGVPGVVRGVVIDTTYFTGNYPPHASVDYTCVDGYPDPRELHEWDELLPKVALRGDTANAWAIDSEARATHVRLRIHPDGGVARLRVHGEPRPDPLLLTGTIDLAAAENGGTIVDCSNRFYSSPAKLLLPSRPRSMADGWENARRRDNGNDHVTVRLAGRGSVRRVEIDTSYFIGNAPGWASLTGYDDGEPIALLPRRPLRPDTRHILVVEDRRPVTQVRLDVFPDGGVARLRVWGELN